MNTEDIIQKIRYIQQANGFTLNVEERAALQSSLSLLKRNGKFSKLIFWGKIMGLQKDYLIVQGFGDNLLKGKKTFCSHNGIEWVQLPEVGEEKDKETKELVRKIRARFVGDLSFEYIVEVVVQVQIEVSSGKKPQAKAAVDGNSSEEEDIEDTDEPKEEEEEKEEEPQQPVYETRDKKVRKSITEERRLAHTIEMIDHDTAVVPRGALTIDSSHLVSPNITFEGLKGTQATQLRSYCHLRSPVTANKRSLLQKEGLTNTLDFLDTIDQDIPKGCWTLQEDKYLPQITIRSLLWPGFFFYHVPGTQNHGYVYFGFGEKNSDLGFML